MTAQEVVDKLIKLGMLVEKDGEYYFKDVDETKAYVGCKNLPQKYVGVSINQAMRLFFDDVGITFSKNASFRFDLRTITKQSLKVFQKIIEDSSIDFSILVAKTSQYYSDAKSTEYPMAKYFAEGRWENIYHHYESKDVEPSNNKWL